MDVKELKDKILQLAIRGKLVEQNENEEPASILLEQIKKKKEELINQGKLKKGKVLPTNDNVEYRPFELPNTWEWVRFDVLTICRDGERVPISTSERENKKKIYDYYGASGVIDKIDNYLFDKPLLLIGEDGANLISRSTPIAFIAEGKYWVNNHAHVIDSIDRTILEYLRVYINAIDLKPYVTGTAQPKLNQAKLNSIVVAVPPLLEQKRIVAKVEELFTLIDQLEKDRKSLLQFILYTKNKVLELAIHGKLVKQNEKDESTSILFEKIQNKKQELIKNKIMKKTKPLPPIHENEIPYDLPTGWSWVRLGEIIELLSGRDLTREEYNDSKKGIPYIMGASNIFNGTLKIERWTENPTVIGKKDDLLISVKGTIGKLVIQDLEEVHLSRQIMSLRTFYGIDVKYLMYFMKFHVKHLQESANGFIPGISREDILLSIFPLPPYEEQKRIVSKAENLFSIINEIERDIISAK